MRIADLGLQGARQLSQPPERLPVVVAEVDEAGWTRIAEFLRPAGGRLVSLWGTPETMSVAYALDDGLLWLRLPLAPGRAYPDLSASFAAATRMQRAVAELTGVDATGAADRRAWFNHGHWPPDYHPLRATHSGTERFELPERNYPFVPVAGDGVHEIAVGPIHAGIIEPGHFRFSVVGEKVLRLEQHLGYVHKGLERLLAGGDALSGYRLAGRASGDATVAYAWAYCMALETVLKAAVPARAQALRAVMLERERVANHLGDLGALGNDAGFAFGLAQFSRLKEQWLRASQRAFGHRLMMDRIVPGGVAADPDADACTAMVAQCDAIEAEVHELQAIYEEHAGLQDRFTGAGVLSAEVAAHFCVAGMAGRASGRAYDLRADHPHAPYHGLDVRKAGDRRGDVAGRVAVRFAEIGESIRLIRALLVSLPDGAVLREPVLRASGVQEAPGASEAPGATEAPGAAERTGLGAGWIESWRGEVLVALELSADGRIARCHCHDPSWQAWPALEHAIIGNIVPDFPLINKSFNLSYSGADL